MSNLGEKPKYTWDSAGVKFLNETTHKASHRNDKAALRWLQKYFRNKPLCEINRELISNVANIKLAETSPATANRSLALIRTILRKAYYEWEWIEKLPMIKLFPEAKRRVRWLTQEEVKTLLTELPAHQQDVMLFALTTGLRQANVMHLEWSQIDLVRRSAWIHPDQAKARKAIQVPLNTMALSILERQVGKHLTRVFTFRGKPIGTPNTNAWRAALVRAGIKNFRWHDLRHTWASWLTQQGTPMNVLQELGGWESIEMVRRYAHLSSPQLSQHSEAVSKLLFDAITISEPTNLR